MDVLYLYFYILDRMLPERMPEAYIYNTTLKLFINLSKKPDSPTGFLQHALQQVLSVLGYTDHPMTLHEMLDIIEENIDEKLPRRVIM